MNKFNKSLTFILIVAIIVVTAAVIVLTIIPNEKDLFTEFYILNSDGKAYDYPQNIKSGEPFSLIIGIINHEGTATSYRVASTVDNSTTEIFKTGILQSNAKYEKEIDLLLKNVAAKQRVELFIYKDEELQPLIKDPLVLFINIVE